MLDNLQNHPAPQPCLVGMGPSVARPRKRRVEEKPHTDFLDLPDVTCDPEKMKPRKWVRFAEARQTPSPTFPDCLCAVKEVKPHGTFLMEKIHDVPWGGKSVIFDLRRRRWMCKTCRETVAQAADFLVEDRYKMTRRLLEYLQEHSLFAIERQLSKETGVFVRKIREIRGEFVERLKNEVTFDTPRVLGMDGVRADGRRRRIIITDIEEGLVIDFLKSGSAKNIARRLKKFLGLRGMRGIQIVVIDMCKTLRAAVKEALPDAVIIIDLFHVMRIANQAMDAVRIRLFPSEKKKRVPGQPGRPKPAPFRKRRASLTEKNRKHMEYWFRLKPELRAAYDLKEDFLEIFDDKLYDLGVRVRSKAAASHFYDEWRNNFPAKDYPQLDEDFKLIFTPMKNWGEYIFNYFDFKVTNAFTESMNRKVKDIIRNSRGCNFETMKARIVYGTYLMKKRDADREAELQDLFPGYGKGRGRQPAPTGGKAGRACREGQEERFRQYEIPGIIQLALDFIN